VTQAFPGLGPWVTTGQSMVRPGPYQSVLVHTTGPLVRPGTYQSRTPEVLDSSHDLG